VFMKQGLLVLVAAVLVAMLSGCMGLSNYQDQSYSEANNPIFEHGMEDQQWIRDEFATYKSRRGHKAFAIAVVNGHVYATGFGDDKVTMALAETEALRMCAHYSQGVGRCTIVDKEASADDHGLTQAEIDMAPKELIAHRDIHHYLNYLDADAPKAFIVAACSGQAFWVDAAESKQQAEQEALQYCENGRHPSDPCCMVLESE